MTATSLTKECKILIQRLKSCDTDEVAKNPQQVLKYYPVRDPDSELSIFDEVYCILDESLLAKSYRFKILYFVNILLSSSKVPGYIVAAYIKRLSRLTLNSKPRTLVIILGIIGNLFLRHPILLILRDRVDERARELEVVSEKCTLKQWLDADPFDSEQKKNLLNTNAMDSSVWELMPLRFHRHPRVAEAASFLSQSSPPEMEFEFSFEGK